MVATPVTGTARQVVAARATVERVPCVLVAVSTFCLSSYYMRRMLDC